MLVLLPKIPQVARGEELCDEVDALALAVVPGKVALDDVGMVQVYALFQLTDDGSHLLIAQPIGSLQNPAPSDVNALLEVESLVYMLESA